ncbi:MAG: hypothetical protein E7246_00855 [Lachnoclostridium sp.]|nr:hypothetical protein [Lachnoclostridium sp.]
MKQHFTSREDFEAYTARTGLDDDAHADIYMGYGTTDFREAWDIAETCYLTDKAYMLMRYSEYCYRMTHDIEFDKSFEDYLDCDIDYYDYYHSTYTDWLCQKTSSDHSTGMYSWNEVQKMIQLAGTLITDKDYVRLKT